jgi:outer membrane protein TolC
MFMMKKLLLPLAILCPFILSAQVDYNKIIIPSAVKDVELREKLVQTAWKNHPSNRIAEYQILIQKEQRKQVRNNWSNGFGVTFNINEFVLNPDADQYGRSAFWPKYNVWGKFSLDQVFISPSKKREASYKIRIAEEELNLQKLEVRNNVLKAYQDYLRFASLFKIQQEISEDANTDFLRTEQKFKDGTSTLDEYNRANKTFTEHRRDKIFAENQYLKAKYDLEYLVGARMEDIQ